MNLQKTLSNLTMAVIVTFGLALTAGCTPPAPPAPTSDGAGIDATEPATTDDGTMSSTDDSSNTTN